MRLTQQVLPIKFCKKLSLRAGKSVNNSIFKISKIPLDLYIIKYIMNLVLDSKLVLLQTHYWLVHSPTPFALAIFFEISYHISPFSFFLEIMNNLELERLLNEKLSTDRINDYAPNGLQVEGKAEIKKIITGVTASQALIDYAVAQQADAVIVHHGYFWKSENPCIRGMKGKRIKTLLVNDINLYGYHLPLDVHPELGNNAKLAQLLGIDDLQPLENSSTSIPVWGTLKEPVTAEAFAQRIEQVLQRKPLICTENGPHLIHKIGICTGGGQGYIDLAAAQGCDAFITGEVSEQTIHSAREQGIHFFAAGHHATERYGIKALGKWLTAEYGLDVEFKDIDNPA